MHLLRLLFATFTIISFNTQAMESPEGKELLRCLSPESLAVLMHAIHINSLHSQTMQELTLLIHSMNLATQESKPKSKFERVVDLAIKLNACLIKDASYYREIGSIIMEYFPHNPITLPIPKTELEHATRKTLKNIVRLAKHPFPDLELLEQTISQIYPFNLKYLLSTKGLPLVIEDTTNRYKNEMLAALAGEH